MPIAKNGRRRITEEPNDMNNRTRQSWPLSRALFALLGATTLLAGCSSSLGPKMDDTITAEYAGVFAARKISEIEIDHTTDTCVGICSNVTAIVDGETIKVFVLDGRDGVVPLIVK